MVEQDDLINCIPVRCTCSCNDKRKDCRMLVHAALRNIIPAEVVHLLLYYAPDAAMILDEFASLPIHIALENKASKELLMELIDIYPGCCKIKDRQGLLPLHIAAWSDAPPEVVSRLIQLYPEACAEVDLYSFTPLCLGAWNSCSFETLSMLVKTWPEACREKNTFGSLPLHSAVQDSARSDSVALLLQIYPQASRDIDNDGNLPIHVLSNSNDIKKMSSNTIESLRLLLKSYPESVHVSTSFMQSPVNIFFEMREHISNSVLRMVFNASPSLLYVNQNYEHLSLYRELNWQPRKLYVLVGVRVSIQKAERKHNCGVNCICMLQKLLHLRKMERLAISNQSSMMFLRIFHELCVPQPASDFTRGRGQLEIRNDIFRYIMTYI